MTFNMIKAVTPALDITYFNKDVIKLTLKNNQVMLAQFIPASPRPWEISSQLRLLVLKRTGLQELLAAIKQHFPQATSFMVNGENWPHAFCERLLETPYFQKETIQIKHGEEIHITCDLTKIDQNGELITEETA